MGRLLETLVANSHGMTSTVGRRNIKTSRLPSSTVHQAISGDAGPLSRSTNRNPAGNLAS
jgi:hypothetical protein